MTRTELTIGCVFTEPLLGSSSGNPELQEKFIASKSQTAAQAKEETEAVRTEDEVQAEIKKTMTVFPHDSTGVHLWDYQIKGFYKEALLALIELGDVTSVTKYGCKKAVDSFVFVFPRKIYLRNQKGEIIKQADATWQRPLRADTMQGERIALANSEKLPEGTRIAFTVHVLETSNPKAKVAKLTPDEIRASMDYGALKGMGQWRSGGFGRFEWEETQPSKQTGKSMAAVVEKPQSDRDAPAEAGKAKAPKTKKESTAAPRVVSKAAEREARADGRLHPKPALPVRYPKTKPALRRELESRKTRLANPVL